MTAAPKILPTDWPVRRFRAALFDMDGTIVNSIAAAERVWGAWAQAHGLDVAAFLPTIHGKRSQDTIAALNLPGIDPEVLDITVLGESVRIVAEGRTAETPHVTEESDYRWLVRERPVGRADRTVSLPSAVDPAGADATVRDGVLIVTLPKVARPTSVRIAVRAGTDDLASQGADERDVIELATRA